LPGSGPSIDTLIAGIAHRAGERGSKLTKLRLVKFLYLLDVFYAQSEGRTFTGWPWAFVHYGPYCKESTDCIDRAQVAGFLAAQSFESKFNDADFQLYAPGDRVDDREVESGFADLPFYVKSQLIAQIDQWAGDTYGLLDYVYFRTGPMADARPGAVLNFSIEKKPDYQAMRPIKLNALSGDKMKKLRDGLERMKKSEAGVKDNATNLYDRHYLQFINDTYEPETEPGLTGVARVNFTNHEDD
jgi:hypothetical protein